MKLISPEIKNTSKAVRWLHASTPPIAIAACVFFTAFFFSFGEILSSGLDGVDPAFYCLPNGVVRLPWGSENVNNNWDRSLFLSITLGFGKFDFAGAKAIDIAWDLVVGRGGQVLIIAVVFPVFRKSLLYCLEHTDVSLDTFASLAFSKVSLESTLVLARDFFRSECRPRLSTESISTRPRKSSTCWSWRATIGGGWSAFSSRNWTFLSLAIASIYILTFPTFLSAMTGYQAVSTAYITTPGDSNLIPASDLVFYDMIVKDGSRIGLSDPYRIAFTQAGETTVTQHESEVYSAVENCMFL